MEINNDKPSLPPGTPGLWDRTNLRRLPGSTKRAGGTRSQEGTRGCRRLHGNPRPVPRGRGCPQGSRSTRRPARSPGDSPAVLRTRARTRGAAGGRTGRGRREPGGGAVRNPSHRQHPVTLQKAPRQGCDSRGGGSGGRSGHWEGSCPHGLRGPDRTTPPAPPARTGTVALCWESHKVSPAVTSRWGCCPCPPAARPLAGGPGATRPELHFPGRPCFRGTTRSRPGRVPALRLGPRGFAP